MRIDSLHVKRWIHQQVERLGIHAEPMAHHRPVDARHLDTSPLALSYRYPGRTLLLDAPSDWGIGLFSLPMAGASPLPAALREARRHPGRERSLIREALEQYYADWQPDSAAAFFGLSQTEAPQLACLPSWSAAWPWEPLDLEAKQAQRRRTEGRESAYVLGHRLDVEVDGWKFCGPVSPRKLEVEVERLARLLDTIGRAGFKRHDSSDGDIQALMLVDDEGVWRWQVLAGQHRYAVISGLSANNVTIRVGQIIRRQEVTHWPWVVAGLFSLSAALKVFDACFAPVLSEVRDEVA